MPAARSKAYRKLLHEATQSIKYDFVLMHSTNADEEAPQVIGGASADLGAPDSLRTIEDAVQVCRLCKLSQTRTRPVAGEGVEKPLVMVIGEAPGAQEDKAGRPFVGPAGQYLDKWLHSISLSRTENVFITNTVKCRPPNNRDPEAEEYAACNAYLMRQVLLLEPQCILALGRIAARLLIGKDERDSLASMRRSVHSYGNIPVFVTYHPSAVLRNDSLRRPVWEDLQGLKRYLDEQTGTGTARA